MTKTGTTEKPPPTLRSHGIIAEVVPETGEVILAAFGKAKVNAIVPLKMLEGAGYRNPRIGARVDCSVIPEGDRFLARCIHRYHRPK